MGDEEEQAAVVVDNGTGQMKAGFSGKHDFLRKKFFVPTVGFDYRLSFMCSHYKWKTTQKLIKIDL